jgi:hypothetical protein
MPNNKYTAPENVYHARNDNGYDVQGIYLTQ